MYVYDQLLVADHQKIKTLFRNFFAIFFILHSDLSTFEQLTENAPVLVKYHFDSSMLSTITI